MCYNKAYPKGSKKEKEVLKMRILKNIFNWFMLALGSKNELTNEAVNDDICNFSGQGRNKYGK